MPRELERVQDDIEVVPGVVVEDNSASGSDAESVAFKSSLSDVLNSINDFSKPPSRDDFMHDIGYWCVRNKVPHQWVDKLLPIFNKYVPFDVPLTAQVHWLSHSC